MEAGEMEMRKAFEDVTTNNVKAILEHGNTTRKIVRELSDKNEQQDQYVATLKKDIDDLKLQVANIQQLLYRGGTS